MSASEVSGPVATTTSPGGSDSTSPTARSSPGAEASARSTPAEKRSRSTASASPAGTRARSASPRMTDPSRRSSACSSPMGVSGLSDRRLLLHTSSAGPSVRWAGLRRSGFISQSRTGMPRRAS